MPDFFVNAEGGQFAFLKEEDAPDWSRAITRSVASTPDALPADDTDGEVLDVTSIRRLVVLLKPKNGATYEFDLHGWAAAQNNPDFYVLDGGVFDAGYTKNKIIQVNVQGIDGFFPQITALDTGSVDMEYAPLAYEE